jgi:DNA-directed RNA polymerase III subunit RPC4
MSRVKRGRGRGASSLGAAPSRPESGTEDTPSTIAQANADTGSQISPNSSPADAPTETPASTPARVPVQRLDSLSTRGGPSARGARAGATSSRFKPKAVRRGAEEREKAAREIEEKKRAKDKDAAREAREADRERGGRSRGRGMGMRGRGRGDAMGRGGLNRASVASGPFGMAPAGPGKLFVKCLMI